MEFGDLVKQEIRYFIIVRLVFVTFKTEVNGIWLLLSQCVVVFMLERYGCPQFAPQFDNECLLFEQLSCDFKKTWLSFVLFGKKKPLNFYQLETKRRED